MYTHAPRLAPALRGPATVIRSPKAIIRFMGFPSLGNQYPSLREIP